MLFFIYKSHRLKKNTQKLYQPAVANPLLSRRKKVASWRREKCSERLEIEGMSSDGGGVVERVFKAHTTHSLLFMKIQFARWCTRFVCKRIAHLFSKHSALCSLRQQDTRLETSPCALKRPQRPQHYYDSAAAAIQPQPWCSLSRPGCQRRTRPVQELNYPFLGLTAHCSHLTFVVRAANFAAAALAALQGSVPQGRRRKH